MEIKDLLEAMGLAVTIVAPGRMGQATDTSAAAGKRRAEPRRESSKTPKASR
jgi:hypothetical protein